MAKKKNNGGADEELAVMVVVESTGHLMEDGTRYKPGDRFETTMDRAEALGTLVRIISDEQP